jgi:hypothetical protein
MCSSCLIMSFVKIIRQWRIHVVLIWILGEPILTRDNTNTGRTHYLWAILYTTNPTRISLQSNPGYRCDRLANTLLTWTDYECNEWRNSIKLWQLRTPHSSQWANKMLRNVKQLLELQNHTEHRGRVVGISASYLGGPGFRPWIVGQFTRQRLFMAFLSLSTRNSGYYF